jgi:hypothetical protein
MQTIRGIRVSYRPSNERAAQPGSPRRRDRARVRRQHVADPALRERPHRRAEPAILSELSELASLDPQIRWVSPLRPGGYREFWDAAFLRALGFDELAERLAGWWPGRGGPRWDALARLEFPDGTAGVLLAEGKSYPAEMHDKHGLGATSSRSIATIERAFKETQRWLGVDKPVEDWKRPTTRLRTGWRRSAG